MAERQNQRAKAKAADAGEAKPCPICGKPRDKRYAPFCSKRCADVDLHRWLKGTYVIPGGEPAPDRSEDEED